MHERFSASGATAYQVIQESRFVQIVTGGPRVKAAGVLLKLLASIVEALLEAAAGTDGL